MSTTVTVMGKRLILSDDDLSPETIREAAEYIEKQMESLRLSAGVQDTMRLAALTMIQVTGEMLELKKKGYSQTEGYSKVLEEMTGKLEEAINL